MIPESAPPHRRRPRYRGTHPRRFTEKYKELNPERYAAEVAHVRAKGRTPAGMHLPICVNEILEILQPAPGELFLDATLGYGGHAQQLLPRLLPDGRYIGLDVDPHELPRTEARLRALGYGGETLAVRRLNFAGVLGLPEAAGGFDGVLADLGVSSMQLDNPARGFTWKADGPLDLRLNPQRGVPASTMLLTLDTAALAAILAEYADEPHAEAIARAVKASPMSIETTTQLARVIRGALPRRPQDEVRGSLQRTFMALRIAVNEELSVLDRFLDALPWCLKPGGRVAILTFHSGEDRRVKQAFKRGLESGIYRAIAPTPLRPSPEEQRANPRSSCAKLRWAVRSTRPVP
ncbi:MAG TPA: 16S rRNA (cytosine(1402)-N(4))-methyltransferase RsmH [bacterium]|nr:16S rRNA (cytosine(1402)-N(4))-methyltransferase RsmH [bacterium]